MFFYIKWFWYDLGIYIGGFCVIVFIKIIFFVVGWYVNWEIREFLIWFWYFDKINKILIEILIMFSSGDISYFGLILDNDLFYMFYYLSYIDN